MVRPKTSRLSSSFARTKLRATTVQGLLILQELAVQTGRLEVLAHLRTLVVVDGDEDRDYEG